MKIRMLLVAGVIVAALAAGLITAFVMPTARANAPAAVEGVPATIPPEGVTLLRGYADVILMPPSTDQAASPAVSAEKAAALAPAVDSKEPPTTVLAVVTVGSSLPGPGESPADYRSIQDKLAWVVTYTYPEPIDVGQGKPVSDKASPPTPIMRSHANFIIDAQTGKFLLGFFTR